SPYGRRRELRTSHRPRRPGRRRPHRRRPRAPTVGHPARSPASDLAARRARGARPHGAVRDGRLETALVHLPALLLPPDVALGRGRARDLATLAPAPRLLRAPADDPVAAAPRRSDADGALG